MTRFKKLFLFPFIVIFSLTTVLGLTGNVLAEVSFSGQAPAPVASLSLWYRQPATDWMTQALPIGNGRLGGMVFGGVTQEHIQFNENTLWTGDQNNLGNYQNFGDLYLDFTGLTAVTNYRRDLSLSEGISRVTYNVGTTTYNREYFCSYPDKVMVLRLTSNASGNLNFSVRLVNGGRTGNMSVSGNRITMTGALDILSYEAQVLVMNEGGTLTTGSDRLTVNNANAVTIILDGGTDYSPTGAGYRTGGGTAGVHTTVTNRVNTASVKSYGTLKTNHLNDFQTLFNRVSLNVGQTTPTIPTDQLVANYKNGTVDKALEVLLFQYGRYFTIAGSRGGSLPTNLQGIWNNSNTPAWASDYHSNINIEMNYWPTQVTNLAECFEPFSSYVYNEAMAQTGWKRYATEQGCNGWSLRTGGNIFGYYWWNMNNPGNAWYCQNLWQQYLFTLDTNYLSTKAYPVMKNACDFWLSRLTTASDGTLVAPNEWSPEHGPWEDGVSYAQQNVWSLFTNTIKASQVLNVDAGYRGTLQSKLSQLDPGMHIGSWGQLREWKYTNDDPNDTHRHQSYAICLYPSNQLLPLSMLDFKSAITTSLNHRGDGADGGNGYGWDKSWKMNLRARLFDGNRAYSLLQRLIKYDYASNLFDIYSSYAFQIDANFGTTAGVAEMLLQSHAGFVHLLPALPDAWSKGSETGLCARDGFVVDMNWDAKSLKDATITSKNGKPCVVKYPTFAQPGTFTVTKVSDGSAVSCAISGDTITFSTTAGQKYKIVSTAILPSATWVDDRSTSITYSGAWGQGTNAEMYLGTESYSNTTNGYAQFTFTGTDIKWLGSKQSNVGKADVYIDGVLAASGIDCYFANKIGQVELFSRSGLTNGPHTIKVVVTGQKNAASSGTFIVVDAFVYSQPSAPTWTKVDDNAASVAYSSGWGTWTGNPGYNSTEHYSNVAGSTATFTFTGTQGRYYGFKRNDLGNAEIYVDGVLKATVDCYSSTAQYNVLLFESAALTSGTHTLQVKVKGTKNASATNTYVICDAFESK